MAKKPFDRRGGTLTDSKGKVLRAPKDNATELQTFRWWESDERSMAAAIRGTIRFIQQQQSARYEQLLVSTRLVGSTSAFNLMGTSFTRTSSTGFPSTQRLSYNLCTSVIDTLTSKMAKNKVVPTFITNGGVWKVQKKAKQLTKFTQGLFYQENMQAKRVEAFNDAATWGDGFVYVYRKDDKVCIERVLPHELLVDEIEAMVTDPTQLHRVKIMDRDVATECFPELADEIEITSAINYESIGVNRTAADLIEVFESWHLKSGPDAEDGLRVITIGEKVLKNEYEKDYFPFPQYRYNKRKLGWYGQGAVERLQNIQGEINKGMITIQRSHHLMSGAKLAISNTSKIVKQHLDNEIGTIITHNTGEPPLYLTPPIVQAEVYSWVDKLIEMGYQQEGASRMSTTGEVPMGVESGKAMRTLNQISDDRFLSMQQGLEDWTLEVARQAIEVAKDIYKDVGKYEVIFPDTNFMETVDWKDIQLDREQYVLKSYPTSSLADDLTGRLSEVQELTQAGMISPRTGKRLMDMPDVEMEETLSNAAEDYLHKCLEEMLYDGVEHQPEQFNDLNLARQLSLQYYNYAQLMNCPEEKLSMVRNFIAQIDDLLQKGAPPPPMPGAPAPGGPLPPQANPTPTPTSNLVANVPGAA